MADNRSQVKVYLSEEELMDLDDFCEENGMKRSAAIRHFVMRSLRVETGTVKLAQTA